jgi:hypothetical protein
LYKILIFWALLAFWQTPRWRLLKKTTINAQHPISEWVSIIWAYFLPLLVSLDNTFKLGSMDLFLFITTFCVIYEWFYAILYSRRDRMRVPSPKITVFLTDVTRQLGNILTSLFLFFWLWTLLIVINFKLPLSLSSFELGLTKWGHFPSPNFCRFPGGKRQQQKNYILSENLSIWWYLLYNDVKPIKTRKIFHLFNFQILTLLASWNNSSIFHFVLFSLANAKRFLKRDPTWKG